MKKETVIRNICFVIAGLLLIAFIAQTVIHSKDMWENAGKKFNFDNFLEYYFIFNKSALLLGLVVSSVMAGLGIVAQRQFNEKRSSKG